MSRECQKEQERRFKSEKMSVERGVGKLMGKGSLWERAWKGVEELVQALRAGC